VVNLANHERRFRWPFDRLRANGGGFLTNTFNLEKTVVDADESGWQADQPQGEFREPGKQGKIRGYPCHRRNPRQDN